MNRLETKCFVHPDRPATAEMNIPCAPDGKLPVCADCAHPSNLRKVFEAYQAKYHSKIQHFKNAQN